MPQQAAIPTQGSAERRWTRCQRGKQRDADQRAHGRIARELESFDGVEPMILLGVARTAHRQRRAGGSQARAILARQHHAGERRHRGLPGGRSETREAEPGQRVVTHQQQELVRHVGDSVHGRCRREQNALPAKQPGCERAIAPGCRVSEPVRLVDDHRPRRGVRRAAPAQRFVGHHPERHSDVSAGGEPLIAQRGGNQHVHRSPG